MSAPPPSREGSSSAWRWRDLWRDASVLLLDEPLAALDTRTRAHAGRELVQALRGARALAIVVTHDLSEAAMLTDEIFVMDERRIVQRGTELSTRPASAFVADFAGSVVLNGTARPGADGLTTVELDGGGVLQSTDLIRGPVAALVFPWEISLEPEGGRARKLFPQPNRGRGHIGDRDR